MATIIYFLTRLKLNDYFHTPLLPSVRVLSLHLKPLKMSLRLTLIIITSISMIGVSILQHDDADERVDEYSVSICKRNDRACNTRSRPMFSRCFFGTSKNNTYCCNPRTLNKTVPSKNELFKPTVCCSADGV